MDQRLKYKTETTKLLKKGQKLHDIGFDNFLAMIAREQEQATTTK